MNYRILIKCARDDIARKLSKNNVTMKEIKIQNFYVEHNGAWIENHLYVSSSSSKNCNMLSNDLVAPIAQKICTGRFFNMLNPKLPSVLNSDHSRNTSFNININDESAHKKDISIVGWPSPDILRCRRDNFTLEIHIIYW